MASEILPGDSTESVKSKIGSILALGNVPSAGISTWAEARAKINYVAALFGRSGIVNMELGASARSKMNALILGPNWVNGASLALDFANDRAWVDGLSSLASAVTFTRASTGTYFDSAGVMRTAAINEIRRDHDPVTKQPRGVLIEEARTNLFLHSSDFAQSAWAKARVALTPAATAAPDGTMSATLMVEDTTATATHQISQSQTRPAGTASYPSIFIKKAPGGRRYVQVWTGNFANQSQRSQVIFDLDTGTSVLSGSPVATSDVKVQQCANGWWRLSPLTVANGSGSVSLTVSLMADATTTSYTGDGVSGVYIWGGQWEDGQGPTSHITTTTAASTRAAESLQIDDTGWLGDQVAGTIIAEFWNPYAQPSSRAHFAALSDNTTANYFSWSRGSADEGLVGVNPNPGSHARAVNLANFQRVAMAWSPSDTASSRDGDLVVRGGPSARSGMNRLRLGSLTTSVSFRPAVLWVKRAQFHPRRLSDAELQAASVLS